MNRPTPKMIWYAKKLIAEMGYDLDDYTFEAMTFDQCRDLIDELKQELEG